MAYGSRAAGSMGRSSSPAAPHAAAFAALSSNVPLSSETAAGEPTSDVCVASASFIGRPRMLSGRGSGQLLGQRHGPAGVGGKAVGADLPGKGLSHGRPSHHDLDLLA